MLIEMSPFDQIGKLILILFSQFGFFQNSISR